MDRAPPSALDRQRRPDGHELDESDAANPDSDGHCVVCLDVLAEPCQLFPCGHRHFHFPCVHLWLLKSLSRACPICKAFVSRAVHGPSDGQRAHEYVALGTSLGSPATPDASLPESLARAAQPPLRPALRLGRARRRFRGPRSGREAARTDEPAGLAFRRDVYRHLRYSMHVGSNPISGYRELTRDSFRNEDELQRRARTFLRRELRVFGWLATPDADNSTHCARESPGSLQDRRRSTTLERLLGHIIWLLQHFELRGSDGSVEDLVTTHLGRDNTRLLVHELHSFLRSPYSTLEDWDRETQYPEYAESSNGLNDRIGQQSASAEHRAHEQRFASRRYENCQQPRNSLSLPEAARAGLSRLDAPRNECQTGSRSPHIHGNRDRSTRSRSSGSAVPSGDVTCQRGGAGEEGHRPARFVDNGCGPTKRWSD